MVDRWGRPEFEDGARLYQGIRTIQADQERVADRKAEKDAYVAAGLKTKGQDISAYPEDVQMKANDLYWQNQLNEIKVNTAKMQQSEAGMREKMQKLDLNIRVGQERLKDYKAARSIGDEKRAKEIALQISNENMYNGRYIEKDEKGYKSTNFDGSVTKFDDMPIEEIDRLLGEYYDKPPEEIMKWQMSAEQLRQDHNFKKMSEAEKLYDDNGNLVAVKVAPGMWGPDGKPRGVVYMTPDGQREIKPQEAAKLGSIKDAETRADIGKKKAETAKTRKEMKDGGGSPTESISAMKLEAWKSYMGGKATPEQQELIGINKDPYLSQAAQIVSQDYTNYNKSPEEIAQRVKDMSDELRKGRQQKPEKGSQTNQNSGSNVGTWLERGRKLRGGNGGN